MKFRTQYNYDSATMADKEVVLGPSETDKSQNETLSQLIKRFTAQGIVIPPAEFVPEKPGEEEAMLNGEYDDITQSDDFDLADVSAALTDAQEIISNLRNKQKEPSSTPTVQKQQDEPNKGSNADVANATPQTSGQ